MRIFLKMDKNNKIITLLLASILLSFGLASNPTTTGLKAI
jgi:hypothetical protein